VLAALLAKKEETDAAGWRAFQAQVRDPEEWCVCSGARP